MTHSDYTLSHLQQGSPRIGAILVVVCCIFSLFAGTKEVFEKEKINILGKKYSISNDYIFAVGKIKSRTNNRESGYTMARHEAISNIIMALESRVIWPENMSAKFRRIVWKEYLKCQPFQLSAEQLSVIYRNAEEGRYTVVIAIPEKNIRAFIPSYTSIRSTLLNPKNYRSGKLRIAVCMELNGEPIPNEMLSAFALKLAQEYGPNVAQIVLGKNAFSFETREFSNLSGKNSDNLLKLLETTPYAPEICWNLSKNLTQEGFNVTAAIFLARGAVAKNYQPESAAKCLFALPPKNRNIHFIGTPKDLKQPKVNFQEKKLLFLNTVAGQLPIGVTELPSDQEFQKANLAFSAGQLEEAYAGYAASAARFLSFDACNMAGNAGRRIGKFPESIAFLLQAAAIKPDTAYPWIHLAWIYCKQHSPKEMQICIEKAESMKLDSWSQQQLGLLKNEIEMLVKQK